MELFIRARQTSLLAFTLMILAGCTATVKQDGPPSEKRDVSQIPDAVPSVHNGALKDSPYTLDGVTYTPMKTANGHTEEGLASWYGTKFHGKQTAIGEIYDLYGMTAAHKTLPLPSYVKVTRKDNNRSVVVRVNDRGPFVGERVIDLSYAAARKLGFADEGIAEVLVEGIDIEAFAAIQVAGPHQQVFLQLAALKNYHNAQLLRRKVGEVITAKVKVVKGDEEPEPIYRVRIGPVQTPEHLEDLLDRLREGEFEPPYLVYEMVGE
ncbi:MAG: septal ring lytic transglycosylase RlpA family protein [Endozoicomonas sp.]